MKANKMMIRVVLLVLPFIAAMSVDAQRLNWESVLKGKFGPGTQLRTPPAVDKKTVVPNRTATNLLGTTDKKAIVGSWIETVTFPDPAPPLKSLITFFQDGNMLVADQGAVTVGVVFSAGHGCWTHLGERTFAWTQVEIMYDPTDGSLVGYLKVNGVYTVNATGNEYSGEFQAVITAPDGTVLFEVEGTNSGTKIPLELS